MMTAAIFRRAALAACVCLFCCSAAAAPQWTGVQYGENSQIPGESPDPVEAAVTSYSTSVAAFTRQGAVAGAEGYEGDNYDVSVMAMWHPSAPAPWGQWANDSGYFQAGDILQYDESEKHLSFAYCGNGAGQMGGWALVDGVEVAAIWDGASLHKIHQGNDYVTERSSVRCMAQDGYAVASVLSFGGGDSSDYSYQLYLVSPTGQIVHHIVSQDPTDSSSAKGAGAFAVNSGHMVAGYCWRHDPSADYFDGDTWIRVSRPSAAVWDSSGEQIFDFYRSQGMIYSAAFDINDAGHIVGRYMDKEHAFLIKGDGQALVDIPSLAGVGAQAMGAMSINNSDHVCGWSLTAADTRPHAFYWQEGSGPVDLGNMGQDHAWGLKIDDNDNVYGCTAESIFSPDYAIRWSREQAADANGDGTDDTTQDSVVNFTACTGIPSVLVNASGGPISDVRSWQEISNDAGTFGPSDLLDVFKFELWEVPLGFIYFKVPAGANGKTHVQWKGLTAKLPFSHGCVVANNNANIEEDGTLAYAIEVASAQAADQASTTTLMSTTSLDEQGRLTVDLYLSDGGPSDCDGAVNGSIEFFGGELGMSVYSSIGYLLGLGLANPLYASLGVGYDEQQLALMDANGDGAVNVADIVTSANTMNASPQAPPSTDDERPWNAAKWGLD